MGGFAARRLRAPNWCSLLRLLQRFLCCYSLPIFNPMPRDAPALVATGRVADRCPPGYQIFFARAPQKPVFTPRATTYRWLRHARSFRTWGYLPRLHSTRCAVRCQPIEADAGLRRHHWDAVTDSTSWPEGWCIDRRWSPCCGPTERRRAPSAWITTHRPGLRHENDTRPSTGSGTPTPQLVPARVRTASGHRAVRYIVNSFIRCGRVLEVESNCNDNELGSVMLDTGRMKAHVPIYQHRQVDGGFTAGLFFEAACDPP